MSDWKQITARIRRARTGKDPAGQLSTLFARTRDAMVAFELARYYESVNNNDDAGKWYLTAAERFRRADWKTKAQESATRLGATVAAEIPVLPPREKVATAVGPENVPPIETAPETAAAAEVPEIPGSQPLRRAFSGHQVGRRKRASRAKARTGTPWWA